MHAAARIIQIVTGQYPQHLIFAQKDGKATSEIENIGLYSEGGESVVHPADLASLAVLLKVTALLPWLSLFFLCSLRFELIIPHGCIP